MFLSALHRYRPFLAFSPQLIPKCLVPSSSHTLHRYGPDDTSNPPAVCSSVTKEGESTCVQQLACGGDVGANVTSAMKLVSIPAGRMPAASKPSDSKRTIAFISVGSYQPTARMYVGMQPFEKLEDTAERPLAPPAVTRALCINCSFPFSLKIARYQSNSC